MACGAVLVGANLVCADGQYRSGVCPGASGAKDGYVCLACSFASCPKGQYRRGICAGTSNDYECVRCANTACASNEYRRGQCDNTDNGHVSRILLTNCLTLSKIGVR